LLHFLEDDGQKEAFAKVVTDFSGKLEAHLADKTYLTESFSTADICVAVWLAQTLKKLDLSSVPEKTSTWMASTLKSLAAYEKDIAGLADGLSTPPGGSAPAVSSEGGDFSDNPLVQKLNEFGIEHTVYGHVACMTAEELVENVKLDSPKETHTKNLFFKDKKHGMFLVCHATSTNFNTKMIASSLGLTGKTNPRLADAALLESTLGAKPGCVGPLCIVNDAEKTVKLLIDKALMENYDFIHSHPLRNDASVKLTPAALTEYFTKAGIEVNICDFSSGADAAPGGKAPANRPPASKEPKGEKKPKQEKQKDNKKTAKKGETLLALQWKKSENFGAWYSDVIVLSEMIAYYDISGCYILRPWSYKIWDLIQQWFNVEVRRKQFWKSSSFDLEILTFLTCWVFRVGTDSEIGCR
jgi:hypothetical protein